MAEDAVVHSFNEMETDVDDGLDVKPSKMAEERLEIAVQSMAYASHYVGGIDGKFDSKERDQASDPATLNSNLKELLVPGNTDDEVAIRQVIDANPRDELGNKLEAAIRDVEDQGLSRDELIEAMEQLSERAEGVNGFLPFVIKTKDPDTSQREQFIEIIDEHELDLDINEFDNDVDAFYESFSKAVKDQIGEAYRAMLAYSLMYYGTYIGYASGRLFSSNPFSDEESDAIEKVGEIYGLPPFKVMSGMMSAEMKAEMLNSLKSKSFIDQLRNRFLKGLLSLAKG